MQEKFFENLRPEKKIIANELLDKEFDTVLEVGTQYGESLKAIQDLFKDKELVGVDTNLGYLNEGRKHYKGIEFIYGNVLDLPFRGRSFDVVFTNALFCNLPPDILKAGVRELFRVTRKYVLLVELSNHKIGQVNGRRTEARRTGANWVTVLNDMGYRLESRKLNDWEWPVEPWKDYGYLYEFNNYHNQLR